MSTSKEIVWDAARELEGLTLYTPTQERPFFIENVTEEKVTFRTYHSGGYRSHNRYVIERCVGFILGGGEPTGRAMAAAGIILSGKSRSYLPAIALWLAEKIKRERSKR